VEDKKIQEESSKMSKDNSKNTENNIFNKEYKLMAIDIDGTLLDKNSQTDDKEHMYKK